MSVLGPREDARANLPWEEGGPLETIYDVLRKLIDDSPWSEPERRRAAELIRELEHFNIFGTVAHNVTMKGAKSV